ncbi:MAG: potassium channel family protein [Clostridia bacterium]
MRRSWFSNRMILLAAILALFGVGMVGYVHFEELSVFEAFYLLIVSITTVGYGDIHPVTAAGRSLTLILVPVGLLLVFGLGVSLATERLDDLILRGGMGRLERRIKRLQNHFIVCGYGRLGQEVVANLRKLGCRVVVIDKDRGRLTEMDEDLYIVGDALREDVLERAGIHRARALLATFSDDTLNVYLVLEATEIAPETEVISTASDRQATRRLYLAGASRVVSPQVMGADILAKSAYNPFIYQLMSDMMAGATPTDNISQIVVNEGSPLAGRHLRDFAKMDIDVRVMLIRTGDSTRLSPTGDALLEPGSVLVVLGRTEELEKLERMGLPGE